jgi:CHAT domain-containing protein
MAGANERAAAGADEEDGILTAEEIAALDRGKVELVVLSACDTGVGEIRNGEGVLGLRRAFHVAGVRSMIMSLWPVEDESTRHWMTAFYKHRLIEQSGVAEAVHDASLEMLERRRADRQSPHPFFWAAFIDSENRN